MPVRTHNYTWGQRSLQMAHRRGKEELNPKELLATHARRNKWFRIITTSAAAAGRPGKMSFDDFARMRESRGFYDEMKVKEIFDRLDVIRGHAHPLPTLPLILGVFLTHICLLEHRRTQMDLSRRQIGIGYTLCLPTILL